MKTLKDLALLLAFGAMPLCASEADVIDNILKRCPAPIAAMQDFVKQFEESEKENAKSPFKQAHPISVTIQKDAIIFACKGARSIITVKNRGYYPDDDDNVIELNNTFTGFEYLHNDNEELDEDELDEDKNEKYQKPFDGIRHAMEKIKEELDNYGVNATVYLDIKGCLTKRMCTNFWNIDDEYMGIMASITARTIAPFDTIENLVLISKTEEEYASCLKFGLYITQAKQTRMIEKDEQDRLNGRI